MAPSNLQGLNIVHPASTQPESQDLLDFPTYQNFNAQLDLWTNLTFEPDESLSRKGDYHKKTAGSSPNSEEDDEEAAKESDMLYPGDAHENVVRGIPLPTPTNTTASTPNRGPVPSLGNLDLATFLTTFGIDPSLGAPAQQHPQHGPAASSQMPTLQQLLALSSSQAGFPPSINTASSSESQKQSNSNSPPPAKRPRTSKSTTSLKSVEVDAESPEEPDLSTPVTPSEDKRRRNTAASARFRLKKKEREAALEKKAKELEVRVNELEKECEGLRRENGWLKGLVVGVTGGVGGAQQSVAALPTDPRAGSKRGRDDALLGR